MKRRESDLLQPTRASDISHSSHTMLALAVDRCTITYSTLTVADVEIAPGLQEYYGGSYAGQ